MHDALGLVPALQDLGLVAQDYRTNIREEKKKKEKGQKSKVALRNGEYKTSPGLCESLHLPFKTKGSGPRRQGGPAHLRQVLLGPQCLHGLANCCGAGGARCPTGVRRTPAW